MFSYIRFLRGSLPEYAVVEGDTAFPLRGSDPSSFERTGEQLPLKELTLHCPCTPGKIIGVGLNYRDIQLKEVESLPCEPKLFLKSPQAILPPGQPILRPAEVQELSCEVELAVVIGKKGRDIPETEAMGYIWGYMTANDVTASDIQRRDVLWGRAKNYDTFLPLSDRILAGTGPGPFRLRCIKNGSILIDSFTDRMICPVPRLIHYISHVMTLCPGDLILTGTPTGYGVPVAPGDVVEVAIEGIGSCRNPVNCSL